MDFGLRIGDSRQTCGATPLRTAGPGAGCTNKPNWPEPIYAKRTQLGESGWDRWVRRAKQSQSCGLVQFRVTVKMVD